MFTFFHAVGSSAIMPKTKRSESSHAARHEKRVAITIDTLLRERLGLEADTTLSTPKPVPDFLAIAWVQGWASIDPAETVTQVMSPITDIKDNDN